ncbi:MAG: decaprenyl-phosphate phosphoribosyltransferase [Clostridiaceae bacterium]|nr:decaprenyl-phosphate phosphoribosyltransferase [Clostridiaceae bacterium]
MVKKMLKLMRPKQWVKNIFVLVPLVFSRTFTDPVCMLKALGAFVCFTAASSSIYILNDIIDIEKDRHHETKRFRPLASGEVSKGSALALMAVLLAAGLVTAALTNLNTLIFILAYIIMNIFYSLFFKKVVILDIMIIAFGFVLRVITGAVAIDVYISSWVLLCSFFIALCLAAGKRKTEKASLQEYSGKHRKVLSYYTDEFLKGLIQISVTGTTITYSLYTILEYDFQSPMITILFVVFGLFRYMQLVFEDDEGRLPEELILSDKPLLLSILLFGAAWIIIFLTMP